MDLSQTRFMGIELSGTRGSVTCALVNDTRRILLLGEIPRTELETRLNESQVVIAAITSPVSLNNGIMADEMRRAAFSQPPTAGRHENLRVCEYELIIRGFSTSKTPARLEDCSPTIQKALRFSSELAALGFQLWPAPGAERQLMEVHADAAYAQLLGQKLTPARSIEGRIQRQLLLQEEHLNVRDPMIFFEEITRRKLLTGQLPQGILLSPAELNALIAAYTALCAYSNPTGVTRLGDGDEGRIVLPTTSQTRP